MRNGRLRVKNTDIDLKELELSKQLLRKYYNLIKEEKRRHHPYQVAYACSRCDLDSACSNSKTLESACRDTVVYYYYATEFYYCYWKKSYLKLLLEESKI
jgi:hypothetical protein